MPAPAATPAPPATLDDPLDGSESSAPPRGTKALTSSEAPRAVVVRWGPYAAIAIVALVSRLRYAWWGYHDTFGSGDAHLVLTKAWFIERGEFEPSAAVGPAAGIFGSPPLIPLLLGGFSFITGASTATAALILGPALTIVALLALYAVASRAMDRTAALAGVGLVALLPRFSFDSTEPDKVAYVVSFFLLALVLVYEGQRRQPLLLAAGACMGLAVFSHTTAYLFAPVFVLSHVALSWGAWRRMASLWFAAGCAVAVAMFALYVVLDDQIHPTATFDGTGASAAPAAPFDSSTAPVDGAPALPGTAPAAPAPSDLRFVPDVIEDYWRNLKTLASDGFQDSAWDLYFDGIRSQILDPVYLLAIAGFMLGVAIMVRERRFTLAPLLLWMVIVTLGFAIQRPAASHGSRYPSYVTPVFVLMAVFATLTAARWIIGRMKAEPAYALVLAAPLLAWAAISYATATEPGTRRLYEGHREAAEYVASEELLANGDRLLYLGWPSYTYTLLDRGVEAEAVRTFGWRAGVVGTIDAGYVDRHEIRYFLYDDLLDDYFRSSARVKDTLAASFDLREVESFCTAPSDGGCAGHVTLYELLPKAAITP